MEILKISKLSKNFDDLKVLENINISINKGEFVTILGPSGCGKSTLFKLITNLKKGYEGNILLEDKEASENENPLAYMAQKDLLLPWRTLFENACLPLEVAKINKEKYPSIVNPLINEFGLKGFEKSYPHELSGGMKQRVAFLRTFLIDSNLMLLDEPFAALDAITKVDMQTWLLNICSSHNKPVLFITHDIDEALFLSDKIYVMTGAPGKISLELKVDFPKPRDKSNLLNENYLDYKKQILEVLKN